MGGGVSGCGSVEGSVLAGLGVIRRCVLDIREG